MDLNLNKHPAETVQPPSPGSTQRRVWHAPEITILPLEHTENAGSTGTDGHGAFTHS